MFTFTPKFALLLMLTTLALFLFPAASGSFTATHGPTTAFRAVSCCRRLLATIAAWAALVPGLVLQCRVNVVAFESSAVPANSPNLSLRC